MREIYKNIIIIGRSRCGKSTLATKIAKVLPYQIIRVDSLRDTFFKIFPELEIGVNTAIINQKFQKFLASYLKKMKTQSHGEFGYILEGLELSFENVLKNFKNEKNLIYGLGIENITVEKYLEQMKDKDTIYDWTYNLSDNDRKKHIRSELKHSKEIKNFCLEHKIPFYNTAKNREKVLDEIIEHIKENYKFLPTKPKNITDTDWKILIEKYQSQMEEVLNRLEKDYPVQYLIGNVDFYDCFIKVNESVLIPRFETELFVEKILKKMEENKIIKPNIIDLGTGSGCIAIAIKKNLDCTMNALDINEKALEIAKENASKNQTEINFIKKNMIKEPMDNYDVVISNPPYVSSNESVGKETKYEPQNAIFAKNNGLFFYKNIIKNIKMSKKKPKLIAFEIGMNQGETIKKLVEENIPMYQVQIEKDYQNRDRYIFLKKIGD